MGKVIYIYLSRNSESLFNSTDDSGGQKRQTNRTALCTVAIYMCTHCIRQCTMSTNNHVHSGQKEQKSTQHHTNTHEPHGLERRGKVL